MEKADMATEKKRFAVGDVYRIVKDPITTTQLVKYAGVSGDFNRIHFDHPFAVQAGLGGLLAHGMLTMGFAASCLTEALGPEASILNLSGRFLFPVHVGDVVEVVATAQAEAPNSGLIVQLEATVNKQVVFRGNATATYGAASSARAS
jgi:acyl dehydratase